MKTVIAAAVTFILTAILAPSLQAAECSRMAVPDWETMLLADVSPQTDAATPEELKARAIAQIKDSAPAFKPNAQSDECDNWACWQNPDPPLCACDGFWCGPIFICGVPCGPGGC